MRHRIKHHVNRPVLHMGMFTDTQMLPAAGLFALGAGFGVLVTSHRLPWWLAPVISVTMFAGSVEFILIGMLATAAPLASIAVTTFLINSRHLFCRPAAATGRLGTRCRRRGLPTSRTPRSATGAS